MVCLPAKFFALEKQMFLIMQRLESVLCCGIVGLTLIVVGNAQSCIGNQLGWTLNAVAKKCYKFPNNPGETYDTCVQYCTSLSATTLCIMNDAERIFLDDKLIGGVYIGSSLLTVTPLAWDGSCTSTYTNWATGDGQPDTGAGNYVFTGSDAKWYNTEPDFERFCACEAPAVTLPTRTPTLAPVSAQPTTTTSPVSVAPSTHVPTTASPSLSTFSPTSAAPTAARACVGAQTGWFQHEEKCYTFTNSASYTFGGCYDYCAAADATMLCVVSESEQTFITTKMNGDMYLGALIDNNSNALMWTGTCASTYSHWAANEPGAYNKYYVIFNDDGMWQAGVGSDPLFCGCEASAQFPPSLAPSTAPSSSSPTSAKPVAAPTQQPSRPTVAPSSVAPTMFPSPSRGPTFKQRNGFAFAAKTANGSQVFAWGEAPHGGDASGRAFTGAQYGATLEVVGSGFAYAAVKEFGHVQAWGVVTAPSVNAPTLTPHTLVATRSAFAGITSTTSAVFAFGSKVSGGVVDRFSTELSGGVASIAASYGAFSALKSDGTLYAWGSPFAGGGESSLTNANLTGVVQVVGSHAAFAARLSTGRVVAWGDAHMGGDTSTVSSALQSGVEHLLATPSAFVAFKADHSIVVWGYGPWGGDASSVQNQLGNQVRAVYHNTVAMAAVKLDGTVVAWGKASGGGDCSAVQAHLTSVARVYSSGKAFAALTAGGRVVAWGKASHGGVIPDDKLSALASGVVSVYSTNRAFAALKATGQLVVWGQAGHGGPDPNVDALLLSGVRTVCANDVAFSAIKSTGEVVAWGHAISVPVPGVVLTAPSLSAGAVCD